MVENTEKLIVVKQDDSVYNKGMDLLGYIAELVSKAAGKLLDI